MAEAVEWTFLTCTPEGKILKSGPSPTQTKTRCLFHLTVPENLLKKDRTYMVSVRRKDLNQFERTFKDRTVFNSTLVKDGEAAIDFAWPEDSRSALIFSLSETETIPRLSEREPLSHNPLNATPSLKWQVVATMSWISEAGVGKEIDLPFHANQLSR